jgi:hypothetical protein
MKILASILLTLGLTGFISAEEPSSLQGKSLLPDNTLGSFIIQNAKASDASMEKVAVEGQEFKKALRLILPKYNGGNPGDARVDSRISGLISEKDVIKLAFKIRAVEAPENKKGKISVYLLKKADTVLKGENPFYLIIPNKEFSVGSEWKQCTIYSRVNARQASVKGKMTLRIQFNYQKQVIEVADVHLENLGPVATIPSMPGSLLPKNALASFSLGNSKAPKATMETVAVTGQDFKKALRLTIPEYNEGDKSWFAQAISPINSPLGKEDVIELTFRMRTVEASEDKSGKGEIAVLLLKKADKLQNEKVKYYFIMPTKRASAGSDWEQFRFYARVKPTHASESGQVSLNIQFDLQKQVVEVADIHLENLGPDADIQKLKSDKSTHGGKE